MPAYIFRPSPFAAATGDLVPSRINTVLSETVPQVILNRAGSYSETPQAVTTDATQRTNLTIGTQVIIDTAVVLTSGEVVIVPVENVQTDQGLQPTQNAQDAYQPVSVPVQQNYYTPIGTGNSLFDLVNPGNLFNRNAGGGVPPGNQGDGGAYFYWNPDEIQHQPLYIPPAVVYSEQAPAQYGYNEVPTYSYVPPQSQESYYVEPDPAYTDVWFGGQFDFS